jgi:hypothetical protein
MVINTISIKKKLNESVASSKRFQGLAKNAANTRFVFALKGLEEDIDNSEVSKQVVAACENPAITQSEIISKGNIAAAIGFYEGAEPIENLKEVLKESISMDEKPKVSIDNNKVNFAFRVRVPSKKEIYSSVDDFGIAEWTNRSWLDMIENGITYLAKYIFWSEGFKTENSRSGTGLQSKGDVKNKAEFTPQKNYLKDILDKFIARFK